MFGETTKAPTAGQRDRAVHDAIVGARTALHERGRARGRVQDDEGRVCIQGALNVALRGAPRRVDFERGSVWARAERAIAFAAGTANAPVFNDNPNVTDEMVDAALVRAAAATEPIPDTIPAEFFAVPA